MFKLDFSDAEKLEQAMKDYQGDTEATINDVLHNFAGNRAQEDIYRLMPVSRSDWAGKPPHAKHSKALQNIPGNLSVTVTTARKYGYLYFPDDGTSTRRHVGNQQFFERGGEAAMADIIERCVLRLTNEFEKGV